MNIVELFAHIGLKADHAQADQFLSAMRTGTKDLLKMAGVAFSVAEAIKLVGDSFSQALELKKFSAETGASTDELQRWQQVADQASGSGAAVAESIRAITANQERIKLGQGNISGYQLLGIDPRTDPFKLLELLRQKTQGMSRGMQKNILAQFGVSGDLITTLQLTNKEFDQMAGRAWVISPSMIEGMNKARSALTEAGQALNYFKNLIASKLAPEITKIVKQFTEWARVNQTQIITGIQKAWEFLKRMVEVIIHVGTAINDVIKNTVGWKVALAALVILISPVTAGILALLLVLDDLYMYSKGGKSVFGELVGKFPGLAKLIGDVGKNFGEIFKWLKTNVPTDFSDTLGLIKSLLEGISTVIDALNGKKVDWKKIFGNIFDKADKLGDDALKTVGAGALTSRNVSAFNKAHGFATDDALHDMIIPFFHKIFGGGSQQKPDVHQTVNFVVNGATDPKQFALYVKAVLARERIIAQGAASSGNTREAYQ